MTDKPNPTQSFDKRLDEALIYLLQDSSTVRLTPLFQEAKQAITQAVKQLVRDVKPLLINEPKSNFGAGRNSALDLYEATLLKALDGITL